MDKKNNKTINFAERKKAMSNKQSSPSTPKNVQADNTVIKYDINKMREQINQQTKNRQKNKIAWNSILVKSFYGIIALLFVVLILSKLTNNFGLPTSETIPDKFKYETTNLSNVETAKYENIVDTNLKKYVGTKYDIEISDTNMYKNNKYMFVNGHFNYTDDSDKIGFNMVIESEKVKSIVVNGYELVNE